MRAPTNPDPHQALPSNPVIDAYKPGVDLTLIRENLRLTPDERVRKMLRFREALAEIRGQARSTDG